MDPELTPEELRERFENLTLAAADFSHHEHLRVAWTYLREHSLLDVLRIFPEKLKRFAASIGAGTIYHETITWAFLMLISDRMMERDESWESFIARNGDLLQKDVLHRYYDRATLASERAKRTFVFPRPVDGEHG